MRSQVLVIALCLGLILVAAAPRAAAVVEKPRYARGDFWSYRTTLAQEFGLQFDGNSTIAAGTVIEVDIQGERLLALELSVEGGGLFSGTFEGFGTIRGGWTITGAEHWETDGWNSVRSFVRITAVGTLEGGPQPVGVTLSFVNETIRRVTEDTFAWPIREESTGETRAHWNATQNVTVTFEGFAPQSSLSYVDADFVTTHVHSGTASATVPAGSFDTHLIEESGPAGGGLKRWFAPRVGADVRQQEYNETGAMVASSDLTDFRYRAGEPAPPFPWLYAVLVALATSAGILLVVLALRRRRPVAVWMPPEPENRSP